VGQGKKQCRDINRQKVERAKLIIKGQMDRDDPDTYEFVRGLLEKFPEVASMDKSSWDEVWAGLAKRDCIRFGISAVAKLFRELAEKL